MAHRQQPMPATDRRSTRTGPGCRRSSADPCRITARRMAHKGRGVSVSASATAPRSRRRFVGIERALPVELTADAAEHIASDAARRWLRRHAGHERRVRVAPRLGSGTRGARGSTPDPGRSRAASCGEPRAPAAVGHRLRAAVRRNATMACSRDRGGPDGALGLGRGEHALIDAWPAAPGRRPRLPSSAGLGVHPEPGRSGELEVREQPAPPAAGERVDLRSPRWQILIVVGVIVTIILFGQGRKPRPTSTTSPTWLPRTTSRRSARRSTPWSSA